MKDSKTTYSPKRPHVLSVYHWRIWAYLTVAQLSGIFVTLAIFLQLDSMRAVVFGLPAAVLAGLAASLLASLILVRNLNEIEQALRQLAAGQLLQPLSGRFPPLQRHLDLINELGGYGRQVSELRGTLTERIRATAALEVRNRLARDLHDSIKQQIFSMSISAATAEARWESDPAGAKAALVDVRRGAKEAMVEMNALLQQLRPAPLEKVGLVAALREQCEALGYRSGAVVTTEFGDLPPEEQLPPDALETLFRIAQEALANVARHARASKVHLRLRAYQHAGGEALLLEIQDDGQGFDPEQAEAGMGLANMRARAEAIGGELIVNGRPGHGTTIRVEGVPVQAPEPAPAMTGRLSDEEVKAWIGPVWDLSGGGCLVLLLMLLVLIPLAGASTNKVVMASSIIAAAIMLGGIGYQVYRTRRQMAKRGGDTQPGLLRSSTRYRLHLFQAIFFLTAVLIPVYGSYLLALLDLRGYPQAAIFISSLFVLGAVYEWLRALQAQHLLYRQMPLSLRDAEVNKSRLDFLTFFILSYWLMTLKPSGFLALGTVEWVSIVGPFFIIVAWFAVTTHSALLLYWRWRWQQGEE